MTYPPICARRPVFLHGGDYNPDQWPESVWETDFKRMKEARVNVVSLAIFAWARLEPEEGRFTFGWLDRIMELARQYDVGVMLATPTAAHPRWMSERYPEVQRVWQYGQPPSPHTGRVNFCLSSPVYREKAALMTRQLAERYRQYPILAWHIHNEYGGGCYCDTCVAAFQHWLRERYGSLEALNAAWWTGFWSQTFFAWEEIHPHGPATKSLDLDWKRFVSDQCLACYLNEADIVRAITPGVPVTTNTYGFFVDYDGRRWAPHLDFMAQDSYPQYHGRQGDRGIALDVAFQCDYYRGLKQGRPFLLLETTPSSTNWMPVAKLKRPGVHRMTALQHIGHGAESVMYFQWHAGRGGAEQHHGAVITHSDRTDTRVFRDVAELGALLETLTPVIGAVVPAETAVIYDDEVQWAIDAAAGPRAQGRDYAATCRAHYEAFWTRGIPVDVVSMDAGLDSYKLVVAPMLYLLRPGVAERLHAFVEAGGTLVTTYWSGIVDASACCFTGGFPGPLRDLLGVWAEELDVLYDDESVRVMPVEGNALGLEGPYEAGVFCDQVHAVGAEVQAVYGSEFYAGRPALTVNRVGAGSAWYIASRNRKPFHDAFYGALIRDLGIACPLESPLPEGVSLQVRTGNGRRFLFAQNFGLEPACVALGDVVLQDLSTGARVSGTLPLPPHDGCVLEYA